MRRSNGPSQRQVAELAALSTWIVAPTSTSAPARSFRPEIDLDGTTTRVVVDQLTAVDHLSRLGDFAGRLAAAELVEVDHAAWLVLGLFRSGTISEPTTY